jgi:peptide/nickel transport system substrate-binding protein
MRRLACLLALFGAFGCGGSAAIPRSSYVDEQPPPPEPAAMQGEVGSYGGRFVVAVTSNPETFNPVVMTTTYSADIGEALFTSLTQYRLDTQQRAPSLASSWSCADDAMSCTFHLRRGAKFSDGHAITAADVAFSFNALLDPHVAAYQRDNYQMDGMPFSLEAPDPLTVTVKAPKPNADLLGIASSVPILPQHLLEPALKNGTFNSAYALGTSPEHLVTSGPWVLKQYLPNERTVLTRNPYWFGVDQKGQRLPYLDELTFTIVPDTEAADLKFRAGEADAIARPSEASAQWYFDHQRDGGFTMYDLGPNLSRSVMFFNQNVGVDGKEPPAGRVKAEWFQNRSFRRAVSMAIDRDAIIQSVYSGRAVKSWADASPGDKRWGRPDVPHDDYDPEAARKLLASLGLKDRDQDGTLEDVNGHPVSFTLNVSTNGATVVAMGNFIRDDLDKVGIKVTLAPIDFNSLSAGVTQNHQYDAVVMGFSGGRPEVPSVRMWQSGGLHPWQRPLAQPLSPEQQRVDDLARQIVGSTDDEARKRWLLELDTIVNQQAWVIWLPVTVAAKPVRNGFGNVHPSVLSNSASAIVWTAEEIFVKPQGRPTN